MNRSSIPFAFAFCALALCGSALRCAAQPELVDLHQIDPTVLIDLRYASPRNITGRPLYPANQPALLRPAVAAKLVAAQNDLLPRGFRLKVWDAYRPKAAHDRLWEVYPNKDYVGNPADGIGSLHTWGVAVDVTLVDDQGREVAMPTDFDAFTPAAMMRYTGKDPFVNAHLNALQRAMYRAGFVGLRTEWWHFVVRDWQQFKAITQPAPAMQAERPSPVTSRPRAETASVNMHAH